MSNTYKLFRSAPTGTMCTIVLAALVAGCGGGEAGRAAQRPQAALEPKAVRLVAAASQLVGRTVTAEGTLTADEQAELAFNVAGRIANIAVDLGSTVRKGNVIATLDPTDFQMKVRQSQAALEQARVRLGLDPKGSSDDVKTEETAPVRQARAVLEQANADLERARKLAASGVIAKAQLDSYESAQRVADARYQDALEEVRNRQGVLAQRKSELDIARQQLTYTELRAPFDGAVSAKRAAVGEIVSAGTQVLDIVRVNVLRMRAEIPEGAAPGIAQGQPVRIRVQGQTGDYNGRVARISPVVNEQNRILVVEIEVDNRTGALRPGSFATAEIGTAVSQTNVTVPASAVVSFAGVEKIFTVKNGKAVEKLVTTGKRDGDTVEITSGLEAGEQLVAEPGNIVTGQPVTLE